MGVLEQLDETPAIVKRPGDSFSGRELCDIAGITYRQLDYWARLGLLRPSVADARGSGSRRRYGEADVEIARAVGELMAFGGRGHLTDQIASAVRILRLRRIDPVGEWLAVPLRGEVVRLGGDLPASLPSPCHLIRVLPYTIPAEAVA
jgi:hypothetical protein